MLCLKKFWSKNVELKKFWVQNNYWFRKILVPKKTWVKKDLNLKKNCRSKIICVSKTIFGQTKFWVKQNFGSNTDTIDQIKRKLIRVYPSLS